MDAWYSLALLVVVWLFEAWHTRAGAGGHQRGMEKAPRPHISDRVIETAMAPTTEGLWKRIFRALEQPIVLTALFTVSGIVGTILLRPIFIVCGICILLGVHRSDVLLYETKKVKVFIYTALAVGLTIAGIYLNKRLDFELNHVQTSLAKRLVSFMPKEPESKKEPPPTNPAAGNLRPSKPPVTEDSLLRRSVSLQIDRLAQDVYGFAKEREKIEKALPPVDNTLPQDKSNSPYVRREDYRSKTAVGFHYKGFDHRCRYEMEALSNRDDLKTDVDLVGNMCQNLPRDVKTLKDLSTLLNVLAIKVQNPAPRPPSVTYAAYGDLKERTLELSKKITKDLNDRGYYDSENHNKLAGDREKYDQWCRSLSNYFGYDLLPKAIAIRDEFAQFHYKDEMLDSELDVAQQIQALRRPANSPTINASIIDSIAQGLARLAGKLRG